MNFSNKQISILERSLYSDKWLEVIVGAWGTGKTEAQAMGFGAFMLDSLEPYDYVISGQSAGTVFRNQVPALQRAGDKLGVTCYTKKTPAGSTLFFGHQKAYILGGNDEGALRTLAGLNLAGFWLDEATLTPATFLNTAMSRLRLPGVKCKGFVTTNANNPGHWLKKEFIDRIDDWDASLLELVFPEDAMFLDERTRERYLSAYTGFWRDRYILNKWVGASGLIYMDFEIVDEVDYDVVDLGIDYGVSNPTVAIAFKRTTEGWVAVDEIYLEDTAPSDQSRIITNKFPKLDRVIIDPSAAALKVEFRKLGVKVTDGINDIETGLQTTDNAFRNRSLKISSKCNKLIDDMYSYEWDKKATERGEDKPEKTGSDHGPDAVRYWCMNRLPSRLMLPPQRKPRGL